MSSDKSKSIKCNMIIEVAGRPPEHLTETLNKIIEKMDQEEGVVVENKKINEPVLMKNREDFYTSFAVVEMEVEEISILANLAISYMPAHIEIIEPELIAFTSQGWGEVLNGVLQRLHQYDEVARIMQTEKAILANQIKMLKEKNPDKKD